MYIQNSSLNYSPLHLNNYPNPITDEDASFIEQGYIQDINEAKTQEQIDALEAKVPSNYDLISDQDEEDQLTIPLSRLVGVDKPLITSETHPLYCLVEEGIASHDIAEFKSMISRNLDLNQRVYRYNPSWDTMEKVTPAQAVLDELYRGLSIETVIEMLDILLENGALLDELTIVGAVISGDEDESIPMLMDYFLSKKEHLFAPLTSQAYFLRPEAPNLRYFDFLLKMGAPLSEAKGVLKNFWGAFASLNESYQLLTFLHKNGYDIKELWCNVWEESTVEHTLSFYVRSQEHVEFLLEEGAGSIDKSMKEYDRLMCFLTSVFSEDIELAFKGEYQTLEEFLNSHETVEIAGVEFDHEMIGLLAPYIFQSSTINFPPS